MGGFLLWVGFAVGIFRLVTEFLANEGIIEVNEASILGAFLGINFLHFALFLFIFCAIILMVVSKMGEPQPSDTLELVTFQKRSERPKVKWSSDATLTVILIVLVLVLWVLFSTWGIA